MSKGSLLRMTSVLLALGGAVAGCDRGGAPAEQANAAATADEVSPDEAPAAGPVNPGAVDRSHAGTPLPATSLVDGSDQPTTIARGKPTLVNLWATWCAPCVKELPSLAAAAKATPALTFVAASQDMDAGKAKAFLAAHPIAPLTALYDPKLSFSLALGANLPTTILYGADGKERWRVTGGRDWTSAESAKLLAEM